ncbi:MBL fold metallo-hydrolase [Lacibacter sp. H407]|uniref:MBL fold metallo-hydrolase n=1 Tax=Lacibacter sp. H407 TaxID=3133423 RepID=UPI0030C109EA
MKNNFCLAVVIMILQLQLSAQTITVTLLGTGAPQPTIDRFGAATLVEAGGRYFLFDCGRGVTQRLWQKKIGAGKVNYLFLTHLHSDHIVGIPDLWLLGLMPGTFGNRKQALEVYGPAGTNDMIQGLKLAYQWDIKTRVAEYPSADSGSNVKANDVREGVVYDKNGVKITAFWVNHSDIIDSALGYRLDYMGRSVVISGDTRYSENLIQYSKGADLLIHEVIAIREDVAATQPLARKIINFHTTPEDAGKIFALAKPKLAVYTHVAIPTLDPSKPPLTTDDIIARTRKYYSGQLAVGEDLMVIEIGESVKIKE